VVKGVDAIEHTASPVHMNADDPNGIIRWFMIACLLFKRSLSEMIIPAVQGTIGILQSAAKFGWDLTIPPSNVPNLTRHG
jgi:hypothetical protein